MAELHADVQTLNKEVAISHQSLPYIVLKMRFPFLYVSTSLDTKTLSMASNHNFESCVLIHCLVPQHILWFFHLCHGFCLCLWQLCSLLCHPP